MDKVVVKSKYNEKLHSSFYLFHMFRKSASIYFFITALILMIYMAIQNTFAPGVSLNNILLYWALTLVFVGAIPMFTFGKIRAIVKQAKSERKDSLEIIEITKYKITRKIEGTNEKVVLGWENFESVYEVKDCFYMYIDKDRGLVIAKDAIVEGDVEVMRKLVNNNLKPTPKGKVKFKKMFKEENND